MSEFAPSLGLSGPAATLASEIRACARCDAPERICLVHLAALDSLMPQRCTDPACYGCNTGAGAARAEQ